MARLAGTTVSTRLRPSAAPGRLPSQVISRSLRSWGGSSGANVNAVKEPGVKEPGHFEVRKSSSLMHIFPQESWRPFSSRGPQNAGRQRRCKNKRNKAVRYGSIFIFCSPKQSRAKAVDLPASSFDLALPGVAPPLAKTKVMVSTEKQNQSPVAVNFFHCRLQLWRMDTVTV